MSPVFVPRVAWKSDLGVVVVVADLLLALVAGKEDPTGTVAATKVFDDDDFVDITGEDVTTFFCCEAGDFGRATMRLLGESFHRCCFC